MDSGDCRFIFFPGIYPNRLALLFFPTQRFVVSAHLTFLSFLQQLPA
jgi:hypothetical protein